MPLNVLPWQMNSVAYSVSYGCKVTEKRVAGVCPVWPNVFDNQVAQ